jgi:hypothetical protein
MARFEEEVVERWYIIRGYLTARNIGYESPVRRPGGRGRGEIDILAVKLGGTGVEDRVRCEVSVSVASTFPFISKARREVDKAYRLVKKFFSKGAHVKAVEYLGSEEYRCQLVSSELAKNYEELLRENLPRFGSSLVGVAPKFFEGRIESVKIRVEHNPIDPEIEVGGVREIEIVPFQTVVRELRGEFERLGLMKRDFADPTMRSIQYLAKYLKIGGIHG